jgi:nuclear transport factor 2 (NTF2) superfamily protein
MTPSLKPPFTAETARAKVQAAEDGWNSRDPQRVALAYSPDSQWRNRNVFLRGRDEIIAFLEDKWAKELDYRLMKELWAYTDNRISVRLAVDLDLGVHESVVCRPISKAKRCLVGMVRATAEIGAPNSAHLPA